MTLPPGLHHITAEAYHADPAERPSLSSTIARILLDQSPLHAWTASPRLNPMWKPTESKTFDIGRAAHRAILGAGGDYEAIPAELLASNGAASTKAAREWIEDARARGVTPLKAEEVDQIGTIADSVRRKLSLMGMVIDPAHSETVAIAEIDGVMCRCMVDYAPPRKRWLLDLKTTQDASVEACIRSVVAYGYDVQAAHYLDVWKAATGETRTMRFAFIEKAAPYEVSVIELHDSASDEADWMMTARSKAAEARRIWGECLQTNTWPGYPAQIAIVGAPAWHNQKWADRSVGGDRQKPTPETLARAQAWQAPIGA